VESRREFLKKVISIGGMVILGNSAFASTSLHKKPQTRNVFFTGLLMEPLKRI
jgi:hypothetical protein